MLFKKIQNLFTSTHPISRNAPQAQQQLQNRAIHSQPHSSGSEPPIVRQPAGSSNSDMMPDGRSLVISEGLKYLSTLNFLLVKQHFDLVYVKFDVKNVSGQIVYTVDEEKPMCCRYSVSDLPFELRIYDKLQNEIIHVHHPCNCYLHHVDVSAPPGNVIGTIDEKCTFWYPEFQIKNHIGKLVLRIKGHCAPCQVLVFNVTTPTGQHIGKISKNWSGLGVGISFPQNLDVHHKALLLSAAFLIVSRLSEVNTLCQSLY